MTTARNHVAKVVLLLTVLVCCVDSLGDCGSSGTTGWYGAHYDSDVSGEVKVESDDIRIIDPANTLHEGPPYIEVVLTPTGNTYYDKTYVVTVKSRETTYGTDSVVWIRGEELLGGASPKKVAFSLSRDDPVFQQWVGQQVKGGSAPYQLLRVEVSSQPAQLVVVTDEPTDITFSYAILGGTLTCLGGASSITVSFQWGLETKDFPNETSGKVMTATGSFSLKLTGLAANTAYRFRAKAAGNTVVLGGSRSFTTRPAPGDIVVTSSTVLEHNHTVVINGSDIQTLPESVDYSTSSNGFVSDDKPWWHVHTVRLSRDQLTTLKGGGEVTVSTVGPNNINIPHTHTFKINRYI